jgi:hypothetical protein
LEILDSFEAQRTFMQRCARYTKETLEMAIRQGVKQYVIRLYEDLECLGFHLEENLSPEDIDRCYLKGSKEKDNAFEYAHFACAVVE